LISFRCSQHVLDWTSGVEVGGKRQHVNLIPLDLVVEQQQPVNGFEQDMFSGFAQRSHP
jgi:hypothetical protein